MSRAQLSVTGRVAAPAAAAYAVIADYREGHPRIVPPRAFSDLVVEGGPGVGAGTLIRFSLTLLGQKRVSRARVSEPEPGRVLVETELPPGSVVSTFTVNPVSPTSCDVTIATDLPTGEGLLGRVVGWMAVRLLTPLYHEEIARLDRVARGEMPDERTPHAGHARAEVTPAGKPG
jgi:hypothetical protein